MDDYAKFLAGKAHADDLHGFAPLWMPSCLKPHQKALCEWVIRKGKAAVFADCGLGKTLIDLVWAENVIRKTNKSVLILTPLAVSPQTVAEGEKFGIECKRTRQGEVHKRTINVTNYERLSRYSPKDFAAVVAIESSILKSFQGKMRRQITDFLNGVQYRLLESATPAPNDYVELGNSSEALGGIGRNQMLREFFINDDDPVGNIESTHHFKLKGHAQRKFWQWVCSWARALRKPSDLGFDDTEFVLPELNMRQHVIKYASYNGHNTGFGVLLAKGLKEQRHERRMTLRQRCEKVAELVPKDDYCVVWCHLNIEGSLLEELIPGAVQVQGSDPDEKKEERLTAFSKGQTKILITKPRIGGFGLNWQHCNRMTFFPSHSYEQWYQAVRRCWRFGQKRPVTVDLVTSSGERRVLANMQRKELQAEEMFSQLVRSMAEYQTDKKANSEEAALSVEVPKWLK
jgi:hypothetical protein